ncbi:bifunctional transcriptional activator/DNA repair enzyme AdaA [Halobacillus sp. B23F22_1]|uniref:bifunctional transcriptional activator/DNA repair enzyme AdaA n=1 Tax=Halobacillus sp. B23F22_1 TaxID=3459514 RepID=UPI00373EF2E2
MNNVYWKAIKDCDSQYDGKFYYAVKTTGIFCRPSCKSKLPKKYNIDVFLTKNGPIKYGYRPCKRCRPDKVEFISNQEELLVQAFQYIDNHYKEDLKLEHIGDELYVNKFYLLKIFSKRTDMSPIQYVRYKRIEEAKSLIESSARSITTIALDVGFKSPSHFSTVFSKFVGMTPTQYRTALHSPNKKSYQENPDTEVIT